MKTENLKNKFRQIKLIHVVMLCAVVFVIFSILGTTLLAAGGSWNNNFNMIDGLFAVAQGRHVVVQDNPIIVDDQVEHELAGLTGIRIVTVLDDVILAHGGDKIRVHVKGKCRGLVEPVRLESVFQESMLIVAVKHTKNSRSDGGGYSCSSSLTVTLPNDYQGDLALAAASGELRARNLPLVLNKVKLETLSGDVDFNIAGYRELSAKTVSGDLALWNVAAPTDVNTVSGEVDIHFEKAAKTHIKTVSGDVDISVPAGESFAVKFQSTSGEFKSSFPGLLTKNVRRNFQGSFGSGGEMMEINTTSGDCELKATR